MKTPEQVAKAELERIGLDSVDDIDDWEHLERIVTLVIKADRAQRFENAIKAARYLKSEDGENLEYDRALAEFICNAYLIPGYTEMEEKIVYVEEKIGVRS